MAAIGHLESKLHVLSPLIDDEAMIEIAVNGDGRVWIERAGDSRMTPAAVTLTPMDVKDLATVIANKQQLSLTDRKPAISTTVEYRGATLRCQAIIPPASAGGCSVAGERISNRSISASCVTRQSRSKTSVSPRCARSTGWRRGAGIPTLSCVPVSRRA